MKLPELIDFFNNTTLPDPPIQLYPGVTITNVEHFVKSSIATLEAHRGKRAYLPYYNHLFRLYEIMTD